MERFLGKRSVMSALKAYFKKSKFQIAQALGIVYDGAHKRVEQELQFEDSYWSSPER